MPDVVPRHSTCDGKKAALAVPLREPIAEEDRFSRGHQELDLAARDGLPPDGLRTCSSFRATVGDKWHRTVRRGI
ncbi:hypothetical protein EVAR_22817_1 [Eumeta japonica]|uniref:Uncharacterized protein n=1 Tax=Eumeta variegata TaxID=151549 RepID=A0A4C1VEU9_EUMVA|nr:hypothetical protein EVAR_22817_1 [Eumeta japonica]